MNSKQFVKQFPKYRWHNNMLRVLDFMNDLKNDNDEYIFNLRQVSAELNIEEHSFKNYLRRLEKLKILIWKRYVGQKGPARVQIL